MESTFKCIESNAAGIDVGSFSHFVAVPQGRAKETVLRLRNFTEKTRARSIATCLTRM